MADLQDHHIVPQEKLIQDNDVIVKLKAAGFFDLEAPENKPFGL